MTTVAVSQLSAEDRALIDDLMARYNRSIDTGDGDEFVSLYAENGAWVSPTEGTFEGRQAIAGWFNGFYSHSDPRHNGQHRVSNLIFESVSDDHCEVWCNWILVSSQNGDPQIAAMGNYIDVLVKEGGRWLFEKRTIQIVAQNG